MQQSFGVLGFERQQRKELDRLFFFISKSLTDWKTRNWKDSGWESWNEWEDNNTHIRSKTTHLGLCVVIEGHLINQLVPQLPNSWKITVSRDFTRLPRDPHIIPPEYNVQREQDYKGSMKIIQNHPISWVTMQADNLAIRLWT